jgi:hypothetical protein
MPWMKSSGLLYCTIGNLKASASDAVLQRLTWEAFPLKAETKATEASLDVMRVLLVSWRKMLLKPTTNIETKRRKYTMKWRI